VNRDEADALRDKIRTVGFRRVPVETVEMPNMLIVSSIRVEVGAAHDRVTVWNRGGCAGVLVVNKGDGETIARALMPDGKVEA